MSKTYSRVNGRTRRTKDDHAKCTKCKCVYNDWRCLDGQEVCYTCLGYEDFVAFLKRNH